MYNYKTIIKQVLGDLITPVSAYMRLRDDYPQSVLMESSDYHGKENSKSFIGYHPLGSVTISHGKAIIEYPDGLHKEKELDRSYTVENALNDFLSEISVEGEYSQYCGLYGYTTFNSVRYFENISIKDETQEKNDAPDLQYILFKTVILFDHFSNEMTIIELTSDGSANEISDIEHNILHRNIRPYPFRAIGDYYSTQSDDDHKSNIRKGIAHCKRGDVFQIVISRRYVQPYEGDDFNLYRSLRSINPSPYLFYFDFGGFRIFGSSPETHCKISGKKAYIDPIAGTTQRTGDALTDRQNMQLLQNDPKENAEHVMLVDLARNDLSRNCHDVKLDFYKDLQSYSHVIHLVSRVSGTMNEESNSIKTFIDTFPAGTLSGAPKVRAMELISEYEPHNRGAYGGCVGFIGINGDLNQAITIRTFVSRNNELWFQAGGGIVAKSDVEKEVLEVKNKLGALMKAIESASDI